MEGESCSRTQILHCFFSLHHSHPGRSSVTKPHRPFEHRYRGGGSLIAMAEHRCGGLLMAGARVVGAG
ncbi:hypothetical protein V6N13_125719 [Hibiscus sabdariffa]